MRREQSSPRRLGRRRDAGSDEEDGGGGDGRGSSGPPPTWDGNTSWEDYNIRARLWLATTKTKARARGPLLLKSLSGTPFESFKYLATDTSWLQSQTNAEYLLDEMAKPEHFGEDQQEHLLTAMSRITFHMKRHKGESWRDYLSRWEVAMRKVAEHNIKLPPAYEGFLMIHNLQLSETETKALLQFTRGDITPQSVREYLRKSETKLSAQDLGSDRKQVKAVLWAEHDDKDNETMAEHDHGEDQELETMEAYLADLQEPTDLDESEILDEGEAAEILATMIQAKKKTSYTQAIQRKKEKELSRGYGTKGNAPPRAWQGQIKGKVTIEELKRRTRCKACDQVGHWHKDPECPKRKSSSSSVNEQHLLEQLPSTNEAFFMGHLEDLNVLQEPSEENFITDELGQVEIMETVLKDDLDFDLDNDPKNERHLGNEHDRSTLEPRGTSSTERSHAAQGHLGHGSQGHFGHLLELNRSSTYLCLKDFWNFFGALRWVFGNLDTQNNF